MTENKLKECLDNQQRITLQIINCVLCHVLISYLRVYVSLYTFMRDKATHCGCLIVSFNCFEHLNHLSLTGLYLLCSFRLLLWPAEALVLGQINGLFPRVALNSQKKVAL